MIDAILRRPGNRAVFNDLLRLVQQRKAIAFVGAGASAEMYPVWPAFIEQLRTRAVKLGKADDAPASPSSLDGSPQQQVNRIVRRLGRGDYEQFLRGTFAPRQRPDGKRYTDVHELLMRLPFRGYVTTNYDPSLDFARMDLRRDSMTSGTPTWADDEIVHEWLTGKIFEGPRACPILWAHGYWQKPSQIVMNAGEYTVAYSRGVYRNTFRKLWQQEQLVFVGFGFSDPRFTFMVSEILYEQMPVHGAPRHLAIVAVPRGTTERGIEDIRADLEETYHVRPLFYQVKSLSSGGEDHSELPAILHALLEQCDLPESPVVDDEPPAPLRLQTYWVHEMTNDAKFVGRDSEIAHLNRWTLDPAVRVIGVTAVGGTGKTALTGHWLMNTNAWKGRGFDALFGWSFYRDPNPEAFLQTLRDWAQRLFRDMPHLEQMSLTTAVLTVLKARPVLVVMDGLEVQQEGREELGFGTFLDPTLRQFLNAACSIEHRSVIVLTSRFAFADIERYMGTAFHQLELQGLTPQHGERLLLELNVFGARSDRVQVSRSLEGHPLALRIFADSVPERQRDAPKAFLEEAFSPHELDNQSPLAGKIQRLLLFYERRLPREEARLLSVVALFHAPATKETIINLYRGIAEDGLRGLQASDERLTAALERLHLRGILGREPVGRGHGYIAHPILRDYFRAALAGQQALRAADLLAGQPLGHRNIDKKDLELLTVAIGVLVKAGEWHAAAELYDGRLHAGDVFRELQALQAGLRTALTFVQDDDRRRNCMMNLSRKTTSYFLNEVGLFASLTGEYELAARYYEQANRMDRDSHDEVNLCIGLRNESHLQICLGNLASAHALAMESTEVEERLGHRVRLANTHVLEGWIDCLRGEMERAVQHFAIATALRDSEARFGMAPLSGREVRCAELLLRTGCIAQAREVAEFGLASAQREAMARCRWVLGACALARGDLHDASNMLLQAEVSFRDADEVFDLARVQVTLAELALAGSNPAAAMHYIGDALSLAQPRGMRLVHADALVMRGRARVAEAANTDELGRALDDADEALRMSRECRYAWAQRDAFRLQAEIGRRLEDAQRTVPERLLRAENEVETLSARLALDLDALPHEIAIARYLVSKT